MVEMEFEKWKQINSKRIYIDKAKKISNIELELSEVQNKLVPLKLGEKEKISIEINAIYEYKAPVEQGRKIGTIIVRYGDEIIESVDILNKHIIEKKDMLSYIFEFIDVLGKMGRVKSGQKCPKRDRPL